MIKDRILLVIMVSIFFSAALLVDYIDELRKQNKNGKKSR